MNSKQPKLIRAFEITLEPKDNCYKTLLDFASKRCSVFSLVWRDQLDFHTTAKEIKQPLRHFIIAQKRTSIWPGTQIFESKATVIHYRITKQTIGILKQANSLYSWLSPKLPEDLAFYTNEGRCWLATVAHEAEAWIVDELLDSETLQENVPLLQFKPVKTDPSLLIF